MDNYLLTLIVLFNVLWTFGLSIVYLYINRQYQETYMGIWGWAWLLSSFRIGLDLLRYHGYDSFGLLSINIFISVGAGLLQLWGMYNLKGSKLQTKWIVGAVTGMLLVYFGMFIDLPLNIYIIPIVIFISFSYIWIGVSLFRFKPFIGFSKYITGFSLILVGLINFSYPFNAAGGDPNTTAIFYSIGLIPWTITIVGILLLYFEMVRNDISSSEKRFRMLVENAKDVIYRITFTNGGEFDYISPSVQHITGYKPKELYERPDLVWEIVGHDNKQLIHRDEIEGDGQLTISNIYTKEGQVLRVEQTFVPIYDRLGKLVAIEGILRNITERIELENKMVRLDCLKLTGETAAGIAHEVRNPLTTVRGFLQIMEQKKLFLDYNEIIKLMITELDRANGIISNFLTFSRVKKDERNIRNLTQLIEDLMPLFESNALYTGKVIKTSLQETPNFKFDENEIKQLLLNLVQNGLEAMEPGGTLEIKTLHEADSIKLVVKDQGPGISPELLEKLGTPFITTKEKGTGLGLAVCYGIAAKHEATISVDSGSEGTTFTISFNDKN